jgi:hypothetical protein
MTDDEYENRVLDLMEQLPSMTDAGVRAAYLANKSRSDDPWQMALAAECKAREIDTRAKSGPMAGGAKF